MSAKNPDKGIIIRLKICIYATLIYTKTPDMESEEMVIGEETLYIHFQKVLQDSKIF